MTAEPHTSGAYTLLFLHNRLESITSGSHVSAMHFYCTQLEPQRKLILSLSQKLLINCRYAAIKGVCYSFVRIFRKIVVLTQNLKFNLI